MEVKPGYKQTEVGVIPEDWDVFSIEKICSRITDGEHLTPKRAENGIYLLSARNVHNGFFLLDDVDFFLESEYQKFKKRVNPEMGDLLISCSGTIGRVCVVPDNFLFGLVRSVAIIKPIKEHIDSNYLMFLFQFDTVQKQIQKSLNQLAQANLFQGQIRQLIIPCPIKKEQTAIATALSDVDALISGLDRLIEKKLAIKQAAMQELLTGKRRLPGFDSGKGYKQTEVGEIPEDWDINSVGSFAYSTSGGTPSTFVDAYWNGDIPWMSSGELNKKVVLDVIGRITKEGLENSSTKLIPKSCVLIGLAGQGKTRGTVAMNLIDLCINQSIGAIFPNNRFNSKYLYYNLDSRYEELRILSSGDGGREG